MRAAARVSGGRTTPQAGVRQAVHNFAERGRTRTARSEQPEQPDRNDWVREWQRLAPGISDYARSQRSGNPGSGLDRQLEDARERAEELSRARDGRAGQAQAEVRRLEQRNAHLRAQVPQRRAQGALRDFIEGRKPAPDPVQRTLDDLTNGRTPARPQGPTLEDVQRARAEQERRDWERTAPGRADYAESQRGTVVTPPRRAEKPVRTPMSPQLRRAEDLAERQAATEREYAKQRDKPRGSFSVCLGGGVQAGEAAAGDVCGSIDSRGVGWSANGSVGVGPGVGAHASVGVKSSSANIDELAGESYYGSGGLGLGPHGSGAVSVTRDFKHLTSGAAFGVGIGGGASGGIEFTGSGRLLDWEDVGEVIEQMDDIGVGTGN
jgi:hypothetical protein